MSDDSVEEIEHHNAKVARMLADDWRKQGIEIEIVRDPTKGMRLDLGPTGLPRGYTGAHALRLRR